MKCLCVQHLPVEPVVYYKLCQIICRATFPGIAVAPIPATVKLALHTSRDSNQRILSTVTNRIDYSESG